MAQMFSIARKASNLHRADGSKANEYLRLEPNGNVLWVGHLFLASRWTHETAENYLAGYVFDTEYFRMYLVENKTEMV